MLPGRTTHISGLERSRDIPDAMKLCDFPQCWTREEIWPALFHHWPELSWAALPKWYICYFVMLKWSVWTVLLFWQIGCWLLADWSGQISFLKMIKWCITASDPVVAVKDSDVRLDVANRRREQRFPASQRRRSLMSKVNYTIMSDLKCFSCAESITAPCFKYCDCDKRIVKHHWSGKVFTYNRNYSHTVATNSLFSHVGTILTSAQTGHSWKKVVNVCNV